MSRFFNVIVTIIRLSVFCGPIFILQSCFTGVEGTSKINLSKKDLNVYAPSPEDKFFADISALPLKDWERGKKFMVTDEKLRVVMESGGGVPLNLGDTISFIRAEVTQGAGGGERTLIFFSHDDHDWIYPIDKSGEDVRENLTVTDLPMLIDLEIVDKVKSKLMGKNLWTKTALWYDGDGKYKKGSKFTPVRIMDVGPGNAFFPLKISFSDELGDKGYLLMNIGNSGNESRNFGKLFSLSDPKNNYRHISPEHWDAIRKEQLVIGMTKEECRLSKGNPSDVDTGHTYSNAMELWMYQDGTYLRFVDGLLESFK